jgi:hypothetical protein
MANRFRSVPSNGRTADERRSDDLFICSRSRLWLRSKPFSRCLQPGDLQATHPERRFAGRLGCRHRVGRAKASRFPGLRDEGRRGSELRCLLGRRALSIQAPKSQGQQKKMAFGDNIYHRKGEGYDWRQENSHHSLPDGRTNAVNLRTDTSANRVLLSTSFTYWGGSGPAVPTAFRDFDGDDIVCKTRNHRSNFSSELAAAFLAWLEPLAGQGFSGEPLDWDRFP